MNKIKKMYVKIDDKYIKQKSKQLKTYEFLQEK